MPNISLMNYLCPGGSPAAHHRASRPQRRIYSRFFRYSKWHRLNQEVAKTTTKNKLDEKTLVSVTLTRVLVRGRRARSWFWDLERRNALTGECGSRILWRRKEKKKRKKASDTSAAAVATRCVLGSLS